MGLVPHLNPMHAILPLQGTSAPLHQLAALSVTLAVAVLGGALSGWVVSKLSGLAVEDQFEDAVFWEVEKEE
jgi:hypothetical protein